MPGASTEDDSPLPQDFIREGMRLWEHPSVEQLRELLTVHLPPDISSLFQSTADVYNDRGSGTAFDEIRQRAGEDAARRMYSLLNEGVQEGLRSAIYHLGRLQWLVHEVERAGKALMDDVRPARPTSLGLPSPALTSEYEAFTLISRATLDRLCRFFGTYFKAHGRNLYRLRAELGANHRGDGRAERLIAAIDRHIQYLDTQISTEKLKRVTDRDRLAHREYVSFTTMNIMGGPDGLVQVLAATGMPDGRLLENPVGQLIDRFGELKATVIDLVLSFFGGIDAGRTTGSSDVGG